MRPMGPPKKYPSLCFAQKIHQNLWETRTTNFIKYNLKGSECFSKRASMASAFLGGENLDRQKTERKKIKHRYDWKTREFVYLPTWVFPKMEVPNNHGFSY